MSAKTTAGLVALLLTFVMLCVGGISIGAGSIALAACAQPQPDSRGSDAVDGARPAVGDWDTGQVSNAATIVQVGAGLHVPPRGWIIAVAVAMQESRLHNLGDLGPRNDHDSLGLFQQRPSQGWGTRAQVLDPTYAAEQFYRHLTAIPSWQDLPLSEAGQRVQRSRYPEAYAQWEDDAVALVQAVGPATAGLTAGDFATWLGMCAALGADGLPDSASQSLPPGFTLPDSTPAAILTAITWALRQLGTPYYFGGDCTNAHSGNKQRQCDCSSLAQQAYRAGGITIPRTTAYQTHAGAPVTDFNRLLPGDLLFIPGSDGTKTSPRHVGIYLGVGLLIQAPHTGDYVKITKLSAWHRDLALVRRIVAR